MCNHNHNINIIIVISARGNSPGWTPGTYYIHINTYNIHISISRGLNLGWTPGTRCARWTEPLGHAEPLGFSRLNNNSLGWVVTLHKNSLGWIVVLHNDSPGWTPGTRCAPRAAPRAARAPSSAGAGRAPKHHLAAIKRSQSNMHSGPSFRDPPSGTATESKGCRGPHAARHGNNTSTSERSNMNFWKFWKQLVIPIRSVFKFLVCFCGLDSGNLPSNNSSTSERSRQSDSQPS